MIFVGEHTSYTHAWIASALESGIRGSVQLMLGTSSPMHSHAHASGKLTSLDIDLCFLELGLVDEAKATVEKWMARWIEVVSTILLSSMTDPMADFSLTLGCSKPLLDNLTCLRM